MEKLLSFADLGAQLAQLQLVFWLASCHASYTLWFPMPSSVAAFPCAAYRKLLSWLLRQPRTMAPSRSWGSLGLSFNSALCSVPADPPLTGRRSQLCRGASPGPVWVLPSRCPTVRQSSSIRASAPFSPCWPLQCSDPLCSTSNKSTGGKMSSSSSTSSSNAANGQGKPKPKSPMHKRGSLQSTTSPGECGWKGGFGGSQRRNGGTSYVDVESENYTCACAMVFKNPCCSQRAMRGKWRILQL